MGRKKIDITKQPKSQRTNTFKKRSEGIKKKAKELSIISDAQVLLLFRTPKGKYHIFQENSSFDGIVPRFISETQENREDSRSTGMNNLRMSFKSDIHALNAISLMDHGTGPTDSQEMQLKQIKMEVSKLESQLGSLRKIDEIEKLEQFDELAKMENSIMELLALNEQQARMESNSTMYNRKIDEIEKLEQLDKLAKMENSIMELLAQNDQQTSMESNSTMYNNRKIDEIEKLEQLDKLAKMENSIMELLAQNDQQASMESNSTMYNNSDEKRCFTISAAGPNSGAASQSRVAPSLAQNNPPMPLISTNYAGSIVNAGFDQRFHAMLEPANLPSNWMNTPAQQYYPAMANDYEAGPSHR